MATVLDASLITFLMPIFVFFLIFAIMFAILRKSEIFGKEKSAGLNFLAAICIAAASVFIGDFINLVSVILPWLVFLFLLLALVFAMYLWLGVKNEEIWEVIGGKITILVLVLVIILVGLVVTFEPQLTPYESDGDGISESGSSIQGAVISTIIHPRFLGALIILIVAGISIKLIVDKTGK